jgi:uncharacterized membrane protein YhaH (DUF805 family)
VATLLLHLPGRHIAIAPAGLLALVPTSGTLIAVAIVITVAIMVSVGMFIVTTAVPVSTFGVRAGHQGHAQHEPEQKL